MQNILDMTLEDFLLEIDHLSMHFKEFSEQLFQYDYQDFNDYLKLDEIQVPNNTYIRLPIYKGKFVAFLMLWGRDNRTAIHDHKNYEGMIKVLKGSLCEISYCEKEDFIQYDSESIAHEGAVFPEDYGGIHSVVNKSKDISVSLHLYNRQQADLEGIRLFDLQQRKIAILSDKATSCAWNLPKEAYQFVIRV